MSQKRLSLSLALAAALAVTLVLTIPFVGPAKRTDAQACWTNVVIECFDSTRQSWPWARPYGANPVRRWRISPALPQMTWGLEDHIYSTALESFCNDEQAIWVIGGPGTEDPLFDDYPANLNTYVTYGPINLTQAQEAIVQFSLYFRNSLDVGDTVTWGADSVSTLGTAHIWIDSTLAMETDGWQSFTMDLKSLYRNNATRDSVSALGRTDVYVFWWFRSNSNTIRDRGAFVDDVIIAWDDLGKDILAGGLGVLEPDSIQIPTRIEVGDSVVFQWTWWTCQGADQEYPPFHAILAIDGEPVADSLIMNVQPGATLTWYTQPIVMTEAGEFNLQLLMDPLEEVAEVSETNNTFTFPFTVYAPNEPPTMEWLSPGPQSPTGDTLEAHGTAMLRWRLTDPDDVAWASIYFDTNDNGCLGPIVPGGANRPEVGDDSLLWDVSNILPGSIRWPYAQIGDQVNFDCVYAPYPVQVMSTATGEPVLVPVRFELAQNYPNPFNPSTQIKFGLIKGGHTTLKVFDITGRLVTTLIDDELTPGLYDAAFNAGPDLPSGVYIYRLEAPEGTLSQKMILMK